MERLQERTAAAQQQSSSHSSSRRTSSTTPREFYPLPTPPPDPRKTSTDNIFIYPPTKNELPTTIQNLLEIYERDKDFYRNLNEVIERDCKKIQVEAGHQRHSVPPENKSPTGNSYQVHKCTHCEPLREECEQYLVPLQCRWDSSASAALAAYGAIEQLQRLFSLWDQYCNIEKRWRQRKECLKYVNLLNEKMKKSLAPRQSAVSDTEAELEQSIALLDSILDPGHSPNSSTKRNEVKQPRERSKSVMMDDLAVMYKERDLKSANTVSSVPQLLRRQSTYSEGKSKVSKWTKVKAAFKWERANVPALIEGIRDVPNGIGLTPVNHEVARYLRVPSVPCGGGSSADSILSSSSGHLISDAGGTPGTISSASSMDDIDGTYRNSIRRDSSKSDTAFNLRITDESELPSPEEMKLDILTEPDPQRLAKIAPPIKTSSVKSQRKSKVMSDFEVLPEDVIADIKSTPSRKNKLPPTPLNLNLKQDMNDLESFYSPNLLKSPKDGTQSLNRPKKVSSPGNSSVPSSPSRHSDFFAEFESEDFSSGDFSEPTSPNHTSSRKTFHQRQDEINQKYQMLRAKLDLEFAVKRREWEKMKANPNACRAITLIGTPKSEEHSPNPAFNTNLSAKLLEENLTPDFKKKLRKWRVKKQISIRGDSHGQQLTPTSPNKDVHMDNKCKIDWNLWRTGQLKLEGQGLTPLPDQKDLPEDFQKKLEQWNKIKRGGSVVSGNDSIKRAGKQSGDNTKKAVTTTDDEKEKRSDKHKPHEKDKMEKLAKLKAIVADHPSKEIEVKTSAGVMKFEGISRKFTRKLYEWEKARGIGPESSTFALLHPGYCPIDVGRITKESHNNENSPTLSRSLSLDSISHNIQLPVISHQASSLSLNDMNDIQEIEEIASSSNALLDSEFKKYEEPEAVMVEVEDHIVETASPLITAHTLVEQQTPIYKFEEVVCNDFCNTRSVQSFESHTNMAPLLSVLNRTEDMFSQLKKYSADIAANDEIRSCETMLSVIRNIYPYYTENITKPNVQNAILDVQSELGRINDLCQKTPLDEACCQELTEERNRIYNEELKGLYESLELLKHSIHDGVVRYRTDVVPDINITLEDDANDELSSYYGATCDFQDQQSLLTTVEATDEQSATPTECIANTEPANTVTVQRNFSVNSGNKKKLRLRKSGSRQNSKTESDSSNDEALETPRRLKRKNFRLKQRSFEEDFRKLEEVVSAPSPIAEDVVYILKVKPGEPIEQCENVGGVVKCSTNIQKPTIVPSSHTMPSEEIPASSNTENVVQMENGNVFVKTKRKIFTTIEQPTAVGGVAVIAQELESPRVMPDTSEAVVALPYKAIKKENPKYSYKSLSLENICSLINEVEERKCHSVELLSEAFKKKLGKVIRTPLAADSFKKLNKSCVSLQAKNKVQKLVEGLQDSNTQSTKEHRFKKHAEKTNVTNSKQFGGATVKKIETKIAKTNSGSSVDQQLSASENNTLPKVLRKIDAKLIIQTTPLQQKSPTAVNPIKPKTLSLPTTPTMPLTTPLSASQQLVRSAVPAGRTTRLRSADFTQHSPQQYDFSLRPRPRTPLTERAQRLQKAKEDFLQGAVPKYRPCSYKRRDEIVRDENWEKYRRSDHSLSSTTTTGAEDNSLLKSVSVETFQAETPTTQSDAGTDHETGIYDSLPRNVTRSGKISSKLGFATLASKFRRVKKPEKSSSLVNANSALSALCRQTLFTDVITAPQMAESERAKKMNETVRKSHSSPQAAVSSRNYAIDGTGTGNNAVGQKGSNDYLRLNKSQSEQIVKCQKESYV